MSPERRKVILVLHFIVCRSSIGWRRDILRKFRLEKWYISSCRFNKYPYAFIRLFCTKEDLFEGNAEIFGKERVNQRIYRRVAITQPKKYGEQKIFNAMVTKRSYNVNCEKGTPTEDKGSHDNPQRFRSLRFCAKFLHLHLDIAFSHLFSARRRHFATQTIIVLAIAVQHPFGRFAMAATRRRIIQTSASLLVATRSARIPRKRYQV